MLEEGQVERSADGVALVLGEHNVAAIVAFLDSLQDVLGIILAIAPRVESADLLASRRDRERFPGVIGSDWVVGSHRGRRLWVALLDIDWRGERRGCERKCDKLRDTHDCRCAVMSG